MTPNGRAPKSALTARRLLADAGRFLIGHGRALATIAFLPLVVQVLLDLGFATLSGSLASDVLVAAMALLLCAVPSTMFRIAAYRLFLTGHEPSLPKVAAWSPAHTAYAGFFLLFQLPWFLEAQLGGLLAFGEPVAAPNLVRSTVYIFLWTPVFWTAATYLEARLSLVLPAVATGEPMSLSNSWSSCRPYAGALFRAGLVASLLWVVLWQLGSFLGSFLLGSDGLLLDGARSLLVSANRLLTDALAIGACSFVYEAVRSRPASEG